MLLNTTVATNDNSETTPDDSNHPLNLTVLNDGLFYLNITWTPAQDFSLVHNYVIYFSQQPGNSEHKSKYLIWIMLYSALCRLLVLLDKHHHYFFFSFESKCYYLNLSLLTFYKSDASALTYSLFNLHSIKSLLSLSIWQLYTIW